MLDKQLPVQTFGIGLPQILSPAETESVDHCEHRRFIVEGENLLVTDIQYKKSEI